MKSLLLLLCVFSLGYAFADTVDYWHVYLNRQVIGRFNASSSDRSLILPADLKETDTLQIRYSRCTGSNCGELAFFYASDSSIIGWNDYSYYSLEDSIPDRRMIILPDFDDSIYWENVFFMGCSLNIPATELIQAWPLGAHQLQFWYTHKSARYRVWTPVNLFTLTRKDD